MTRTQAEKLVGHLDRFPPTDSYLLDLYGELKREINRNPSHRRPEVRYAGTVSRTERD